MSVATPPNLNSAGTVELKCTAAKGMFPFEAGVLIQGADQVYETLMDTDLVTVDNQQPLSDTDQPARLKAVVIKTNCTTVLVELPRQVISGGRRIWVPVSEVVQ